MKNIYDIVIEPNMVVAIHDNNKQTWNHIIFIKCKECILGIYSKDDLRKVQVNEGMTVGEFIDGEFLSGIVETIINYNLEDDRLVYRTIEMTPKEIEEKLGLPKNSLIIKQ